MEFYFFLGSNLDTDCPELLKQIYFTGAPRDIGSFRLLFHPSLRIILAHVV